MIKQALKNIYEADFNPLDDIEENLFNETWKTFNLAAEKGFKKASYDPDADFLKKIKYNNAVYSAFRVHRQQNDIAAKLLDENGKLRTFNEFSKHALPITDHYNKTWLHNEYDTAVNRAHLAAQWDEFYKNKEILPCVEWMETLSVVPGLDHKPFWGTVLPVEDPFWKKHSPGDRWNCKCLLQATDKAKHIPFTRDDYLKKAYKAAPGLDNNPATDAMLFSFSHPFFVGGYMAYKKLAPVVERFVDKQLTKASARHLKVVRNQIPLHNGMRIKGDNFVSGSMIVLRRSLDDIVDHTRDKWMKLYLTTFDINDVKKLHYEGWAENSTYQKTHPKFDPKNPTKRKHPESECFTYYSIKLNGITYYANIKVHKKYKNKEVLYCFTRKKPANLRKGIPNVLTQKK